MTQEQYNNWKDFAVRMGRTVYQSATEKRQKKILDKILDYFSWRELQNDWPEIMDWDGNKDDYFLADAVEEFFDEHRHWSRKLACHTGKLYDQIVCCIRAGFDMAVEQSGGVLGFCIGDVRRMYNGQVPMWVTPDNFASEPDNKPIWL
jgi:hypothetical protein